jgi:glucose/arabinose dehydrogenase
MTASPPGLSRVSKYLHKTTLIVIVLIVVAGCDGGSGTGSGTAAKAGPGGPSTPPVQRDSPRLDALKIDLRRVATGFTAPVLLTNAGDGSHRLFVVEQGGTIRVIAGGQVLPAPFLDISTLIVAGGEQGLLGLAFHPDYEVNGRFFVNYTDKNGDTVVSEYHAEPDGQVADTTPTQVILTIDQPYSNHNGGDLVFGPDRALYVGMGDGGSGGDPENRAQDPASLLGKLLRIDVDQDAIRPEVWASGLRNPWRFSFDHDRGDLWIGDVGQSDWEEIDRTIPGTKRRVNYGWNVMEGRRCYEAEHCDERGKQLPVAVYSHDKGCSVTGGDVYWGASQRSLRGVYLFADYCSGIIWGLDSRARRPEPVQLLKTHLFISSFGEDEDGELYVVDHGDGVIYKVETK